MTILEKIGTEAAQTARRTGIAFGWEVGSLLTKRPVCIASCLHCDDLTVRVETKGWPVDRTLAAQVKVRQEFEVFAAFKTMALVRCCPHIIDHLVDGTGLRIPTEHNALYNEELARQDDRDRWTETGVAFGLTERGEMIAGCTFCGLAVRIPAEAIAQFGELDGHAKAATVAVREMGRAAVAKPCPHWFAYQQRYLAPKGVA